MNRNSSNGLKAILAVNKLGFIGLNNALPWSCPDDLKHFKNLTNGCTLLVGRKTADTLPPLKGRSLLIVSSKVEKKNHWSLDTALEMNPDWVIGGKEIFEQTLHLCTELHLSIINDYTVGDVKCPDLTSFNGETFVYNFEPVKRSTEVTVFKKQPDDIVKATNDWIAKINEIKSYNASSVCMHDTFNESLVRTGICETIEQAKKMPRMLICSCAKCSIKY